MAYVAGTLVHTDKGLVPIEKIKVGDMVLSRDENTVNQVYPDYGIFDDEDRYYVDHVYNIEVEDYHTYFVGRHGIWVHP